MKLSDLDRHPGGNHPLALVVRWLDTLTRSPAVTWAPGQLAAATQAVAEARELLDTDVLTLAGRHFPRQGAASTAAPLAMASLPGFCRCGIPTGDCHPDCPHRPRQTVYADLDLRGEGVDLRNVAEAVAGAVPPGTDVRLSLGDGYEPPAPRADGCTCAAWDRVPECANGCKARRVTG